MFLDDVVGAAGVVASNERPTCCRDGRCMPGVNSTTCHHHRRVGYLGSVRAEAATFVVSHRSLRATADSWILFTTDADQFPSVRTQHGCAGTDSFEPSDLVPWTVQI